MQRSSTSRKYKTLFNFSEFSTRNVNNITIIVAVMKHPKKNRETIICVKRKM